MDAKGEDSGSDTLDQSLQKKCVVADDDSSKQPDAAVSEDNAAEEPTPEPGGNMSDSKDSPASPSPPPPPTQHLTTTDNNTSDTVSVVVKDKEDLPDENNSSGGKEDSRGFESKVRQISNDLKDTTLADENSLENLDRDVKKEEAAAAANEPSTAAAAAPSSSSSTSAATSLASTSAAALASAVTLEDVKNDSDGYDSDRTITYESPSKKSSSSPSEKKKSKKITKKVRFKCNQSKNRSDDEDDDPEEEDDDDDDEEDEEEDTLNESNRCKKIRISLSFASPHDDDGNLSDEASGQSVPETEVEDPEPEGGVENILGKLSRKGKNEYLFRWVDKPGLQWESEEVLSKLCPNLIKRYEQQRAKEREQDMHYVMRRKKIRHEQRKV